MVIYIFVYKLCAAQIFLECLLMFRHNVKRTNCSDLASDKFFGSDLSPPPSSFGVDLTRLSEPRFFLPNYQIG
jgi:hypothetical protein